MQSMYMNQATGDDSGAPAAGTLAAELDSVDVQFSITVEGKSVNRHALRNLSLQVRPGEILVLIGRSGCGKTTVLNLLNGLVEPSRGTVRVLDKKPIDARKDIGYMFARDALLPWRTARRNVEFGLELRAKKMGRKERQRLALQQLEELGLGASSNFYPWQLSQGMRQRVALARTWALEPRILLMDEPFAALDAQTRESAQTSFLETWAAHRRSVVFVTHDLGEAILLADRIIALDNGQVVDEVTVDIPRPRVAEQIVIDPEYARLWSRLTAVLKREQPAEVQTSPFTGGE